MYGLVSIIMPMYNCEKFVEQSIASVQAQTYKNLELIIVDDCSSDNSVAIARKIAKCDPRIRVIVNPENSGAAVSRNYAIREAKGKWIAFLDSDDLWRPEKLEKQISFMVKNNYAFTYTQYSELTEDGDDTGVYISGPEKIGKVTMHIFNYLGCLTVIYNSNVVGLIQVPDLKKRNDWAMWLKVVKKTPCYLLPENLAEYRLRKSGSITHVKGGKIRLLKHHYYLFKSLENMSSLKAVSLTIINLFAGVLKKIIYRKKSI